MNSSFYLRMFIVILIHECSYQNILCSTCCLRYGTVVLQTGEFICDLTSTILRTKIGNMPFHLEIHSTFKLGSYTVGLHEIE